MSPVWSIPRYNTDEDEWRERMEAKSAENHRLWALQKAAKEAAHRKPKPKLKAKAKPKAEKAARTPLDTRTCHCGATFQPIMERHHYCSDTCRRRARYERTTGREAPAPRTKVGDIIGPCRRCGRTLRNPRVRANDYPGTVALYAEGMCKACRRIANADKRQCPVCNGPLPSESRSNQVYCSKYCLDRRPGRRVGTDRIYGVAPCPGCGRATRPKRATLDDYPGTIQRRGGKCRTCATEQEAAA